MKIERLQTRSKKDLAAMARRKGITGWSTMRKEDLVDALARVNSVRRNKSGKSETQRSAARNSGGSSAEEQVERSKYDVGVPTKDLSAKVPKNLPTGYGKDRIVVMVRDPYWLHAYWELTRNS